MLMCKLGDQNRSESRLRKQRRIPMSLDEAIVTQTAFQCSGFLYLPESEEIQIHFSALTLRYLCMYVHTL